MRYFESEPKPSEQPFSETTKMTTDEFRAEELAEVARLEALSLTERFYGRTDTLEAYSRQALTVLAQFEKGLKEGLKGGNSVLSNWTFKSNYLAADQSRFRIPEWATQIDGITANSPTNTETETLVIFTTPSKEKLQRDWQLKDAAKAVEGIALQFKLAKKVAEFFAPTYISTKVDLEVRAQLIPKKAENITEACAGLIKLGVLTKSELLPDNFDSDLVTTKIKAFVKAIQGEFIPPFIDFKAIDFSRLPE